MMATVPHVTSGSGLRKFQADGFLSDRVYKQGVAVPDLTYGTYLLLVTTMPQFPVVRPRISEVDDVVFHF